MRRILWWQKQPERTQLFQRWPDSKRLGQQSGFANLEENVTKSCCSRLSMSWFREGVKKCGKIEENFLICSPSSHSPLPSLATFWNPNVTKTMAAKISHTSLGLLDPPPPPYSGLIPKFFWLLPSPDCAPSLPQGWGGKSLHRGGRSMRSRQSCPHESQQWWVRASQRSRPCMAAPMSTFRTLLDRYNGDTVNMIFVNEEAKSLSCLPGSRNATALKETFSSGGGSDK